MWLGLVTLFPQNPLEYELYDFQNQALLLREGDPRPPKELVMAALDRSAYQQGLRKSHLPDLVESLEGQVVNVDEEPLADFLEADSDGMLRSVQLYKQEGGKLIVSPPLRDYLRFLNLSEKDLKVSSRGVKVGSEFVVTDRSGRFYPFFPVADQYQLRAKQMGLDFLDETQLDQVVTRPSFEPVTVTLLLENLISLEDRITLVGVFLKEAESVEYDTPGGNMVKLQLYAATLSSLLNGDNLRPLPTVGAVTIPLVFLLFLSWLIPGRRTTSSAGIWLLWVGAWIGINLLLFKHHYFLNQSAPIVAASAIFVIHVLRRSWRVNSLLQGLGGRAPLEKMGEEIEATILFTNLPDRIKQLEEDNPEKAYEARAAHSKCVGHVVNQYCGRLVDLQGDAQMIAFGLEGGPHQNQAVACALEIVKQVNLLFHVQEDQPVEVFCGVVTGEVATGQVGGGNYRGVAAIGDTTNSAARLMGQAKKKNKPVLISAETAQALGSRVEKEQVGEISVKGREEALKVWEVKSYESPPVRPVERKPNRNWTLLRFGLLGGAFLSVIFSYLLGQRDFLHQTLLDQITPVHHSAPITIAGIDEESLAFQAWPWPRSLHAQVINNCVRAGVRCVFLDLLFEDPSDAIEDEILVDSILSNQNVVIAAAATATEQGRPRPPTLLPQLRDSERWGLINHAPQNGNDVLRHALWRLPIQGDQRRLTYLPGVVQKIVSIVAPEKSQELSHYDSFLIRWGPKPRTISYHRLLDPNDPIFKTLNGEIVIIGDNTATKNDSFETPLGQQKGVLIHAQTVQTVLNDKLLWDKSGSPGVVLFCLLFAAGLILLSWRVFGVWGQLALLGGGLGAGALFIKVAASVGYFIGAMPLLVGVSSVIVGWLLTVVDTNRSLINYIPQKLQERLERDGTVADLTTVGTVLLTDIRGYTTLSEGRSPSEILELLNSYHEKTAAIYAKYGGHLITYQGDAQIVVFGPLESVQNPVLSALRSAEELEPVVKEVGQNAGLEEGVLRVGSGIVTGPITLGLLGTAGQLQYSVFGAPVRRAHHLQSLSDTLGSAVILDERSHLAVRDVERFRSHLTDANTVVYTPINKGR